MNLKQRLQKLEGAMPVEGGYEIARSAAFYTPENDPDGSIARAIEDAKRRGVNMLPTLHSYEEMVAAVDSFL